jgi:hypothetical protein
MQKFNMQYFCFSYNFPAMSNRIREHAEIAGIESLAKAEQKAQVEMLHKQK